MQGLSVQPFVENGSALVSWQRPEVLSNILLYELDLEPVNTLAGDCTVQEGGAKIISAVSTRLSK